MAYDHLADFLTELEDSGQLVRVRTTVDPALELGALVQRLCSRPDGGPAILFEQVRGSSIPVVANLLGSSGRLCRALGLASLEDLSSRITGMLKPDIPEGVLESLRLVPRFVELSRLPPRMVKAGPCQQVVRLERDVDLRDLPIPRNYADESAPSITAGTLVTVDPATQVRSFDLVPLEVRNRQTLAVHWNREHASCRLFQRHQREGRPLPVAVILGGDPATLIAASAPLPATTDAYLFAGFLRNRGVELVKCRTHDVPVPSDADLILEGFIDPNTPSETAGPIALPTGFYSPPAECPLLTLSAITQRSNPVAPALVHGHPPTEQTWLDRAVERIIQPIVRLFVPEVVDLHFPASGGRRNIAFVSIRKEYPQQARKVMQALWGLGPLSTTKMLVTVDADVSPRDEADVWFRVASNVHPGRDVLFCEGPTHFHDHASPIPGVGHKMGLDATRKLPEEGHRRAWPEPLTFKPDIQQLVATRWKEYGLPD